MAGNDIEHSLGRILGQNSRQHRSAAGRACSSTCWRHQSNRRPSLSFAKTSSQPRRSNCRRPHGYDHFLCVLVFPISDRPIALSHRHLQLSGSLAPIKSAAGGAGVRFLEALGYAPNKGFLVLAGPPSPSLLAAAMAALQRASLDESYQVWPRSTRRQFKCCSEAEGREKRREEKRRVREGTR